MLVLLYLGVMTIYLFTARKTEDGREHQNMLLLGPIKTVVAALRSRGEKKKSQPSLLANFCRRASDKRWEKLAILKMFSLEKKKSLKMYTGF